MRGKYNQLIIFLLLFLISVPIILPYFKNGYFPTHDGEWAVVRLADMFRSLRDGQFPVRFSGNLNFGYGYPLFNFAYPGPYYLGVLIYFLGFGFVGSIKFLFASSVIFSAFTMYLFSSEIWENKFAGFISAIFYVYLPYRIVDLYARGSLGESISFALFPLILFCLSKILDREKPRLYFLIGVLSYAFLILSHNIMALIFTPIIFLFAIIKIYLSKVKRYLSFVLFILLSYGLSAFFFLPALFEKGLILLSTSPIADRNIYFATISDLVFPRWGYGLPESVDGFSYQIGMAHLSVFFFVGLIFVYRLINKKLKKNLETSTMAIFVIFTIALIAMMFPFTSFIWEVTPLLKEVNYPWTLLSQIGLTISFLAGFLWIQKKAFKYILLILGILAIFSTLPYAKPSTYFEKDDQYYLTNEATTTSSSELMPLWVIEHPVERASEKVVIEIGDGVLENINSSSKSISFVSNLKTDSKINVNTLYYPGWKAYVNDQEIGIGNINKAGIMQIDVPKGKHQIQLVFTETIIRNLANMISLFSIFGLFVIVLYKRIKI